MYRLDNYEYPSSEQGLQSLVEKPSLAPVPRNWKSGGYLEALPIDPWGNAYLYLSPGQNGAYDIFTFGADGTRGGDGQNADLGSWESVEQ